MKTRFKNLFWRIFPPDSRVDRFLRKIYHFFPSMSFHTQRLIRQANRSYPHWLEQHEKNIKFISSNFTEVARISFLLSLSPQQSEQARYTIESLRSQFISDWELIITISETVQKPGWLVEIAAKDARIKYFYSQQANIKEMLVQSSGEYFVCCSPGDQFSNSFLTLFLQYFQTAQDAVVFYADCDIRTESNSQALPFFKPDKDSPELLISTNYLSRSIIKKEIAVKFLPDVCEVNELLIQEWDLLIRISSRDHKITHIPYTLIHQFEPQPMDQNQIKKVIASHFSRLGYSGVIVNLDDMRTHVQWDYSPPLISIIIPTRNNINLLRMLLDTLFKVTSYPSFEVILVDNQSDDPETLTYYESLGKTHRVKIVSYPEKFNYSRANNLGTAYSSGDLLLFMNNDMQIIQPDWLSELAQWALIPGIGVVGAKLLFPSRMIQHAGVVIGMQGIAGHLYLNAPDHYSGLMGSVDWYRNVSALTGACQMMRKSVFDELGGYQEDYRLIFSDVDLCLLAIQKGYRILYDPNSVIIHHQSKSRGYYNPEEDILLAESRMKSWLENGDPYYSPNLTYSPIPKCRLDPDL